MLLDQLRLGTPNLKREIFDGSVAPAMKRPAVNADAGPGTAMF